MRVIDITDHPDHEWDTFIQTMPEWTPFHCSNWLRLLENSQGIKCTRLGFYKKDNLIGVLPLFIKRYTFMKVAASPFIVEDTPYMGILINNNAYDDALNVLRKFIFSNSIDFLRIIQPNYRGITKVFSFTSCICKHTHILDLSLSEEQIWNSMEGRCRTSIRKAQKTGIEIIRDNNEATARSYYRILESLYRNQSMINVNNIDFYLDILQGQYGHKNDLLVAKYKGEIIAGAIIVNGINTSYYLNGASNANYNSLSPNNLVQWIAIQRSKAVGQLFYDFVGSDIDRLAKFKKSFGGKLHDYTCIEMASSPLIQLARENYPKIKIIFNRIKNQFGV